MGRNDKAIAAPCGIQATFLNLVPNESPSEELIYRQIQLHKFRKDSQKKQSCKLHGKDSANIVQT